MNLSRPLTFSSLDHAKPGSLVLYEHPESRKIAAAIVFGISDDLARLGRLPYEGSDPEPRIEMFASPEMVATVDFGKDWIFEPVLASMTALKGDGMSPGMVATDGFAYVMMFAGQTSTPGRVYEFDLLSNAGKASARLPFAFSRWRIWHSKTAMQERPLVEFNADATRPTIGAGPILVT